jgi:DNA-directed RNA polymerase subunit E'/Rpb7
MFVLAEMKHVIRTPPHMFHLKLNDAIADELNKKLANKVHNRDPLITCQLAAKLLLFFETVKMCYILHIFACSMI